MHILEVLKLVGCASKTCTDFHGYFTTWWHAGLQIKYVVELASALAKHPAVYRVDLLTRLIKDPKVAKSYGQEEECILKPEDAENDLGGAYIVRLPCGPVDQYIR